MGLGSGVAVSCGVGHRRGLVPALLWCRPAAAAPVRPLPWEPPYATGGTLKRKGKKKKGLIDELNLVEETNTPAIIIQFDK